MAPPACLPQPVQVKLLRNSTRRATSSERAGKEFRRNFGKREFYFSEARAVLAPSRSGLVSTA